MSVPQPYRYAQTFDVNTPHGWGTVDVSITFYATDLELRWLKVWARRDAWTPADFLVRDYGARRDVAIDDEQCLVLDDTTITPLDETVQDNMCVFRSEFAGEVGDEPSTACEEFMPHFTLAECEEIAALWSLDDWLCAWRHDESLARQAKPAINGLKYKREHARILAYLGDQTEAEPFE